MKRRALTTIFVGALIVQSCLTFASKSLAQQEPLQLAQPAYRFLHPVLFQCGPSEEALQEGVVSGLYETLVVVLNPSLDAPARIAKRSSRALPFQAAGDLAREQVLTIEPGQSVAIECDELRHWLASPMTEEFRTGTLMLLSGQPIEVVATYTSRAADGSVSSIDVERIEATELVRPPRRLADLIISEIDLDRLTVKCSGGSCATRVPITVRNTGASAAGPFDVRVTLDPSQSVIVTESLGGLAPGDEQTFLVVSPPNGNCYDPDCEICATADSGSTVAEQDESNNDLCRIKEG